jgi:F-box-like
MFTNLIV